MNKVVNGKMYNTETAQMLAKAYVSEICQQTLYRKRTGEYFLYTEEEVYGNLSIKPLTLSEAKKWAEKELEGTKYEEIFGDIEDEPEMAAELNQQISILLPKSLYDELKAKKSSTGMNVSALIIKALHDAGYGR